MEIELKYLKAIKELLDQTNSEQWQLMSDQTGLKFAWIRQIALGNIDDPSINKCERLHLHLTGKHFPAE